MQSFHVWYFSKWNETICSYKDLYINEHNKFIHNSLKLKTQLPINKLWYIQTMGNYSVTKSENDFWEWWKHSLFWPWWWLHNYKDLSKISKLEMVLRWQRWQRKRTGRPLFPHKFIKRTFERWANSRKQLLNASRGHQAPRKAAHCLLKEVVQNIKHKKRDKRGRDGDLSQEGSLKREVSKHQETFSLAGLSGVLESQRAT